MLGACHKVSPLAMVEPRQIHHHAIITLEIIIERQGWEEPGHLMLGLTQKPDGLSFLLQA